MATNPLNAPIHEVERRVERVVRAWWSAYNRLRDDICAQHGLPRDANRRYQTGTLAESLLRSLGDDPEAWLDAIDYAREPLPADKYPPLSLPFVSDCSRQRFLHSIKAWYGPGYAPQEKEGRRYLRHCVSLFADWIEAEVSWGTSSIAHDFWRMKSKREQAGAHELAAWHLSTWPRAFHGRYALVDLLFPRERQGGNAPGYLRQAAVLDATGKLDAKMWSAILKRAAGMAKTGDAPPMQVQALWMAFPILRVGFSASEVEHAHATVFPARARNKKAGTFAQWMRRLGLRTARRGTAERKAALRALAIDVMKAEKNCGLRRLQPHFFDPGEIPPA